LRGWLFFISWILLGFGIFCWGIVLAIDGYRFQASATVLQGKVTEIRSSLSDDAFVTSPTVQYTLPTGEVRRYKSRFSSSISSYATGDRIDVLWDPKSDKVRLDSFGELYFSAVFLLLVAIFVLFGPIFCIVVYIWIWGWPTTANRAEMAAHMRGER
jgi:hypothetical protein